MSCEKIFTSQEVRLVEGFRGADHCDKVFSVVIDMSL